MTFCTIEEAWGESFFPKEKEKKDYFNDTDLGDNKINRKQSFSRTYDRLKKHNGPKTRLHKKEVYKLEGDTHPIHEEHMGENISAEFEENAISEEFEENSKGNIEKFNNKDINTLLNENFKLKDIINSIKNKNQDINSVFDLCIFLATGIFIIFILDTLSKIVKSF